MKVIEPISLCDLFYAYFYTAGPVALSISLSSLAVVIVQSPLTTSDKNDGLKVYEVNDDTQHVAKNIGKAVVNSVVIISIVCIVTFAFVFLYKANWNSIIQGYLVVCSCLLYTILGSLFFIVFLQRFDIPFDIITFVFLMWNFVVLGVLALFFSKDLPPVVTRAYIICTAVLLAWNISRLDFYTTWALLIGLSLYDVWAVFSRYGPLHQLVSLMNERKESIPAVLYEAELRPCRHEPIPTHVEKGVKSSTRDDEAVAEEAPGGGNEERSFFAGFDSNDETSSTDDARSGEQLFLPQTIKLGLGDFVFYNVLVSRAALDRPAAFVACLIAVLLGLGITLAALIKFRRALPALPLSIFLGVMAYIFVRCI